MTSVRTVRAAVAATALLPALALGGCGHEDDQLHGAAGPGVLVGEAGPPQARSAVDAVRRWVARRNDRDAEDRRWRLKDARVSRRSGERVTVTADVEVRPALQDRTDLAMQFLVVPSADKPVRQVLFLLPRAGGAAPHVGGAMLGER